MNFFNVYIILIVMNICEVCGKQHDGSYGTGRFCSNHCRHVHIGRQKKRHVNNLIGVNSPKEGGWKCTRCGAVFRTRKEKQQHNKKVHADFSKSAWNKGLTKETSPIVAKRTQTFKKRLAEGTITPSWAGKKHSEETKAKISVSRKKYLEEHPEMVPYKLNHKSKGESYPEKYFREWLEKEGIQFQQEFQFHLFSFDFLINEKIDLEIDGDQHFLDQRIAEHDRHRNKTVEEAGYIVKRIAWSRFQSLTVKKRAQFLHDLKTFLTIQ